jgi:hypothetical protein
MPLSTTISTRLPEPAPLHCYRLDLGHGIGDKGETKDSPDQDEGREQAILCRFCGSTITSRAAAVSKNGRHEHVFFNPAGIAFEISCFRDAPGCVVQGEATTDFSWFSGYAWQYALCATCLSHLGWRFSSDRDSFFGLITGRLLS